jgi:hypothetical protein
MVWQSGNRAYGTQLTRPGHEGFRDTSGALHDAILRGSVEDRDSGEGHREGRRDPGGKSVRGPKRGSILSGCKSAEGGPLLGGTITGNERDGSGKKARGDTVLGELRNAGETNHRAEWSYTRRRIATLVLMTVFHFCIERNLLRIGRSFAPSYRVACEEAWIFLSAKPFHAV